MASTLLLTTLVLSKSLLTSAVPSAAADPCAVVAGKQYVPPAQALACLKSFPFNETLRTNVMQNIAGVMNFFTFEDYYYDAPPPYQESTVDIRAQISRLSKQSYKTDYDFNKDLYDFLNQLNDGHTAWFPNCYLSYQNILPAPIVSLADNNGVENVYIAPDSVEFINQLGTNYTSYFDAMKFNWKRLAGAKVLKIGGMPAYNYVDMVASKQSGTYLSHGVRVNKVYTSYRISGTSYSQRLGDLAGPLFPELNSLKFDLIAVNSTKVETVDIPYYASYINTGAFTDSPSFWASNCVAKATTNGIDYKGQSAQARVRVKSLPPKHIGPAMGNIKEAAGPASAVGLPPQYQPTLPPTSTGTTGVIKSYVLPDQKTGVMFVGTFEPSDYNGFQTDVVSAINSLKSAGARQLLIDVTNNGGGYVCLGLFLHQYLAGNSSGYPGFQSSNRANPLAQKIVASDIKLGLNSSYSYYAADNWASVKNDTEFPSTYDYMVPDLVTNVNGRKDANSQRFHDFCGAWDVPLPASPPFALNSVGIVSNGNCASTCALFTTVMNEKEHVKMGVFGGRPGIKVEFKGMAGNQVLEWFDLDSEIKTANLKDDPLSPPDLLVDGNFRHNWRTAWSYFDESKPIAFLEELPRYFFKYTKDTYNNPQNLWEVAAQRMFNSY